MSLKRKAVLVGLVFLVMFMMLTDVEASPVLEFIDVPDRVKLEDAFTFSVKLTDARGYDYFSLYGETPSGEEMYFGERFFDEGLWFMYSDEWTLTFSSFNETGYYTLCVDAGAVNDPDVDMITTSCSIYVEEGKTDPTVLDYLIALCINLGLPLILIIGVVYAIRGRGGKEEVVEAVPTSRW